MKTKLNKTLILNRIKEACGFTKDGELADFLGINKSTLANWYSRNSIDFDLVFSKCENISVDWLLFGIGDEKKQDKGNYTLEDVKSSVSEPTITKYALKTDYFGTDRQKIPLYEIEASAGLNLLFSSQNTQIPLDYISVPNAPKCDGALFVRGDSMYPLLKAGDIVCYKTIQNISNIIFGEMYLLDIDNDDDQFLTVKYVQKSEKGDKYIKLVSENKYHADKEEPISHIRAMAIVKLTIRYNTIS